MKVWMLTGADHYEADDFRRVYASREIAEEAMKRQPRRKHGGYDIWEFKVRESADDDSEDVQP